MASTFQGVYRAESAPGGVADFRPVGADAFGAPIGEAFHEIGGLIERRQEEEKRREEEEKEKARESEMADAAVTIARVTGEVGEEIIALREGAAPGAAGHAEAVRKKIRDRLEPLGAGYQDDRVQNYWRLNVAQLEARTIGDEKAWEAGRRIEKTVDDVGHTSKLYANQLLTNPGTNKDWTDRLTSYEVGVRAMVKNPDLADKLVRDGREAMSRARIEGLIVHGREAEALDLLSFPGASPAPTQSFEGQLAAGTVDLWHRPQVDAGKGEIATVRSISIEEDGNQVLIPTVVGDKIVSDEEAIAHYRSTGEHLGKFDTAEHATAYATALHEAQATYIKVGPNNPLIGLLDPQDFPPLIAKAEARMRARAAEAEAAVKAEQAQIASDYSFFVDRISTGKEIPTEEEFKGIATALGRHPEKFKGELLKLTTLREQVTWKTAVEKMTPAQLSEVVRGLEAKGQKRTPQENRQLEFLGGRLPAQREEFSNEPEMHAARLGMKLGTIDFNDPSSFARRRQSAEAYAAATGGKTPYLLRDEKPMVQERFNAGAAGQLGALGLVQQFGAPAAAAIIDELAPEGDKEALKLAIALPWETQRHVLLGRDSVKNLGEKTWDKEEEAAIWNEHGRALPESMRGVVRDAAKRIYAQMLEEHGGIDEWSEGTYRLALMRAVGSSGQGGNRTGGFHRWHDGPPIVLPRGMKPEQFDARISRASLKELMAATGNVTPKWRNGQGVMSSQAKAMQLESAGQVGLYFFTNQFGRLKDDKGRDVVLDIRKLPAK
jgi:hypothetical protein